MDYVDGLPGDPRFYRRDGPHTAETVAAACGAQLVREPGRYLHGLAPLAAAGPDHVAYIESRLHLPALREAQAGAVLVPAELARHVPEGTAPLICEAPALAWSKVAALFHPLPPPCPGVHQSAVVDLTAQIDPSAEIGPLCVIGARAEIGPGCWIDAGAVIGPGVVIGSGCRIGALASIAYAIIGARVVLHPGARIGQDGFGLVPDSAGFRTMPQLGRVIIGDDVEIGANTTVDRGALGDTVIGAGSRLDNLVQIGHNVRVGRCCVIVAQVGVSGSTVLEDFVTVAGQVGIAGHLTIGARARIGAQAGVMANVAAGADVVGSPAMPVKEFFRLVALLRRWAREKRGGMPDREGTG
jgi:UDP-3-O-[3-hydroxymyristoyl] glucosamine N-acyltransferase